MWFSSGKKERG
jgi:hypothetical protein